MRTIDADALNKHIDECERAASTRKYFKAQVNLQPTIPAAAVVWCKDCVWWCKNNKRQEYGGCSNFGAMTPENGYCHRAERRGEL